MNWDTPKIQITIQSFLNQQIVDAFMIILSVDCFNISIT